MSEQWRKALERVRAEAECATNGDDTYTISGTTYALVEAALGGLDSEYAEDPSEEGP